VGINPQILIPMPITFIPGGDVGVVRTLSHVRCRPRFLVVPSLVAIDFTILDIKIGRNSQMMALGEIPALAFAGDLDVSEIHGELKMGESKSFERVNLDHPIPVRFDDCCNQTICLTVRNLNACARNFMAVFYGELLE
jgi:hypothetical protein